jgi:hypothetical protein
VTDPSNARLDVADRVPKASIGAEIGVLRGDFSQVLLARALPRELHLVDPWVVTDNASYADALYSTSTTTQAAMDQMYDAVRCRFADEIAKGQVLIHRDRSERALAKLPDDYFDWIYIDGDHTHQATLADLTLSARKVKTGGIVAGDDYMLGGWWKSGVVTAVHDFLHAMQTGFVVKSLNGTQYMLQRTR